MTYAELISKALPGADAETVDFVLWNRTPFPFDKNPRVLFKAAAGYRRACANRIQLCDFCDRPATDTWTCDRCAEALGLSTVVADRSGDEVTVT